MSVLLLPSQKRGVVRHLAPRHGFSHRQAHEIFRRNILQRQRGIIPETETAIKGWIADQDATLSPQVAKGVHAFFDQSSTESPDAALECLQGLTQLRRLDLDYDRGGD